MRRKLCAAAWPRRRLPLVRPLFSVSLIVALGVSVSAQVVEKPKESVRFIKPLPLANEDKSDPALGLTLDLASHPLTLDPYLRGDGSVNAIALAHTRKAAWARKVANDNPRSPAATPDLAIVGSGRGREVYGFDLNSGALKWTVNAKDSGISSMELYGDSVYFSTWSCTLERVRITGEHVYSYYLAPTVNTAPVVAGGKAFCSYQGEKGNRLSAHSIETGGSTWSINTGTDSGITAPVCTETCVLLAQTNGILACYSAREGKQQWKRSLGTLTAPVVSKAGLLLVSPAFEGKQIEQPKPAKQEGDRDTIVPVKNDGVAGRKLSTLGKQCLSIIDPASDPGVEFNVRGHGQDGLDYQGARPGVDGDLAMFAAGGRVSAVYASTGIASWEVPLADAGDLTTPVACGNLVVTASSRGHILALNRLNGKLVWCYKVKGHAFEAAPVISAGKLVITSRQGAIIALPTGLDAPEVKEGEPTPAPKSLDDIADEFKKNRGKELPEPLPIDPGNPGAPDASAPVPPKVEDPKPPVPEPISKAREERIEKRKQERAEAQGRDYEPKTPKRE